MEFYQKLQKLRKENGMSQEELAGQLNVSRQAVSKWESGQGYPETDKLLLISNLFGVSVDYLLKNEVPATVGEAEEDAGYYASRETVEGYLAHKRRGARRIALAVGIIILSLVFPIITDGTWQGTVPMFIMVAIGVAMLVAGGFIPNRYEQMETQPLVMDPSFLREFQNQHFVIRKKYGMLIVGGILLIFLAIILMIVTSEVGQIDADGRFSAVFMAMVAVAVPMFIIAGSAMEAADVIANNPKHMAQHRQGQKYGWVYGGIMMVAVAVFLLLGFLNRAWHPAWVAFPVGGILCGILGGFLNRNNTAA